MPAAIEGFVDFDPEKHIPSLEGRVYFITGGTAGLGAESVKALAKHNPAHIYFTGRNASAAQSLINEAHQSSPHVALTFVKMDMQSLKSVQDAVQAVLPGLARLDVLMCNAGVLGCPPALSADGYEYQFAVNHLANAMVVRMLLPVLRRTAGLPGSDVRFVNLSSVGYQGHPIGGILFDKLQTPMEGLLLGSWMRYGQAKLANILYAKEFARRMPNITAVSVHPGVVATDLVNNLTMGKRQFIYLSQWVRGLSPMTPEKGSYSQVWVAAGAKKSELVNGAFYMPIAVMADKRLAREGNSDELAKELWEWTEKTLARV